MSSSVRTPRPTRRVRDVFELTGRVAVITGGAGLLGRRHAEAIAELGGVPVLLDLNHAAAERTAKELRDAHGCDAHSVPSDVSCPEDVESALAAVLSRYGRVDILVNNAARNPAVASTGLDDGVASRLESLPLDVWNADLAVGLTGAFLCARTFGSEMARAGGGVILNIASDLGLVAPDQRLYTRPGRSAETQPTKPASYSVVKHGLIGLTRYLATYWADRGVRANALAPGGVHTDQECEFVERVAALIPMGRLAEPDEYKAAVAFLVSDASSYMNGAVLPIDGGRTCW